MVVGDRSEQGTLLLVSLSAFYLSRVRRQGRMNIADTYRITVQLHQHICTGEPPLAGSGSTFEDRSAARCYWVTDLYSLHHDEH